MYYRILWLKFLTFLLEFHLGLFLGRSQYLFSANTTCIVHPNAQPIHTKTCSIAVPWCRVLTQAWHIPLPLQGWPYALIQIKADKALSCYMALPRSNKMNILVKYSQLLWSGVKFFDSMWLFKANLRDLIAATGLVISNRDSHNRFVSPCDLEIWWMNLENNRSPLLYYLKLYASFQIHWCSQTWVTVRKRSIRVKFGDFRPAWPGNLMDDLEKQ